MSDYFDPHQPEQPRRDPNALARLSALDYVQRRHPVPDGSPGLQFAVSIVLPGAPTMPRRPLVGLLLLIVGVALPGGLLYWAASEFDDIVALALDPRFMGAVTIVGVAMVLTRFLGVAEVAHAFRHRAGMALPTTLATLIVVALSLPVLWVALQANEARGVFSSVFGGGGPAIYSPDGVGDPELTNVLLLGGDAGPGRWGLRTDTIILVSVHEPTGRTALVSIPRNLTRLQFPPGTPMAGEFPNGFTDLANAVFPYVSTRDHLMAHYGRDGMQGEAVALAEGIGYSLGVEVDDYALVNMQGFADIIDAVGGVTLEVGSSIPLPPTLPGERPLPPTIGPGQVDMDGPLAIAYVRSRAADSDYARMARQRQLLAALGSQVSPTDAIRGFTSVSGVLDDSLRTSLSAGEFSNLLDRLGNNSAIGESIGLAPPLVQPGSPDYDQIRGILDAVERYVRTGEPSGYAA